MSTTYHAAVIIGYEAKINQKKKRIKKYNEDTGAPYFKEASDGWELLVEGKTIATAEQIWDLTGNNQCGLPVTTTTHDKKYIGDVVAAVRGERDSYHKGFDRRISVSDALSDLASRIGIPPSCYLVIYTS